MNDGDVSLFIEEQQTVKPTNFERATLFVQKYCEQIVAILHIFTTF